METSVNQRIEMLINSLGISKKKFADKLGIAYGSLNNVIGERQSVPSVSLIELIIKSFENVNSDWLVTGRGEMFLKLGKESNNTDSWEWAHKYIQALEKQVKLLEDRLNMGKLNASVLVPAIV